MFSRGGPITVEALDEASDSVAEALDDWRVECSAFLYSQGADGPEESRSKAAGEAREGAIATFRALLEGVAVGGAPLRASLDAEQIRAASHSLFPGEAELLRRIQTRIAGSEPDTEVRCGLIPSRTPAPIGSAAGREVGRVYLLYGTRDRDGATARDVGIWIKFPLDRRDGTCRGSCPAFEVRATGFPAVLVTDRTGEDGLNLQFADALVHLDVPTSVMRVEQRMGRVDRIGRGVRPIRQHVVLPSGWGLSPWLAWHQILNEGFRVFSESVADLQLVAPQLEDDILARVLLNGTVTQEDLQQLVAAAAAERTRLDERYALDSDELRSDEAEQDLLDAVGVDQGDEALAKAMSDWWEQILGLVRDLVDGGAFRLLSGLVPKLPEVPWRAKIEPCLGSTSRTAVRRQSQILAGASSAPVHPSSTR